jgi:error-prone DNA polymerase
MSFVHLNVASAYSAHYGVNRPEHLVAAAAESFDALAITHRGLSSKQDIPNCWSESKR